MMELNDSSSEELRPAAAAAEPTRAVLGIDLNEIPSPSETLPDSFDVVRSYHDHPSPPPGGPAGVPGSGRGSACAACGKPEVRGHVVVCDGCERGFHLTCAGMRGRQAVSLQEWVCGECLCSGVRSKRWPLGVKSKQILDINASPPSDIDDIEEMRELRKHTPGGNSFGGNPFGAPVTYSNFLYSGNGFGVEKASSVMTHTVKVGFEDILHHTQTTGGSIEEVDFRFPLGKHRSSNNTAIRLPSQNPSEIVLQALRDFVSERHGVLEEGWRVEFKESIGSCEPYVVYCAPNGKTFDSVYEVAYYLGLMSNYNSMGSETRREGTLSTAERTLSTAEKTYLPRKRKSRLLYANGLAENKESLLSDYCKELSSNGSSMEASARDLGNSVKLKEAGVEGNGHIGSQKKNEGLPVQFEDFFVLSLGEVDTRSSYHNSDLISPVGYRSCWHDKITGSFFVCEVLDGGDSGPVFKVNRCSCSALPIPTGSTVLSRPQLGNLYSQFDQESHELICENDASIQMILSDPSPPTENDIWSCLRSRSEEPSNVQKSAELQFEDTSGCDKSRNLTSVDLVMRDDIGEISVEDHSSSSAWGMISQKMVNACSEVFKQKGILKFFCKHVENAQASPNRVRRHDNGKVSRSPLDKFCSSPGSVSIPSVIQEEDEPSPICDVLAKWLDQDRFGLDVDFVQELLEQLPGAQSCSQYQYLNDRSLSSTLLTVGNGHLVVKMSAGLHGKEEVLNGLFRRSKKAKLVKYHLKNDNPPPLGKPLCLRLPPALVGDFYQVWELLSRFVEILGLKEAFSLEELEQELINPWFGSSDLIEKFEREIQGAEAVNSHIIDHTSGQLSSSSESGLAVSGNNPHAFIHMETGAMKEAAQAKLASVTYMRCSGIALTKAHSSLLRVLIGELQSKVAALVDPNFDSGDLKSKRGRKKDVDSSIPVKRTKLNLLPINELTWPELARRYILAVLAMDGNLDSAEITARESSKVFRCLQGDGGVLCGSLTGVAGMEADALLLAESTKQIFASFNRENDVITIEEEVPDGTVAVEKNSENDGTTPLWAQVLEPVRKLPTNVGTRIRKCVYEALEKDPPEWARKILEHSISKEVYKGNASGPTKKAVLSVLADVSGECLPQKVEKGRKRKTKISISEAIMRQCRIVWRRAAAADDTKVFCNLLGRKLINSSDNDDEGLLGSPAMVARPLDFRTIDLRLAAGSYGGSQEAFLEDVCELWSNLRIAYGDQPDLVDLVDTLARTFEKLYDEQVVTLVHKLADYSKLECFNAERKKEIDDLLASTSAIPKAPWDEGVCKVCGIDKDDDSVLLCDTCDGEYHTYCLNPPLARIPEGNWYCPSCVISRKIVQDASGHRQIIRKRCRKNYQGEATRAYLEALAHLAVKMEESEYWEFNVDERTFLLKVLCDELLNSAVIRQHLELCSETSAELQQKLRSLSAEWKNLKLREEILVARAAKVDITLEDGVKEGLSASVENNESRSNSFNVVSDSLPAVEGDQGVNKHPSVRNQEHNNQHSVDTEVRAKDVNAAADDTDAPGNSSSNISEKSDISVKQIEDPSSTSLSHEINGSIRKISSPTQLEDNMEMDVSLPSDVRSNHNSTSVNESQSYHLELKSVKSDLSLLQDSITSVEFELSKLSSRREFLGFDSLGGLYWASAMPGGHSRILVDRSMSVQDGMNMTDCRAARRSSVTQSFAPTSMDRFPSEQSKAGCLHLIEPDNPVGFSSPWVSYQTDAEIDELVGWLKDKLPKERELKESILQWKKLRFQKFQQTRSQNQDDLPTASSVVRNGEKTEISDCLDTRAVTFLEKMHGPCTELETTDISKKRGKRARLTSDEKMYRCECLELIWPNRHHCLSCHRTFFTDAELEEHNDGKCIPGSEACEKGKEISDPSKAKGSLQCEMNREECRGVLNNVEKSKSMCSELSAKLIKFQNGGLVCPYDFEEICSKFVVNDSNKDLIQEIGLIGSHGIPSHVPNLSPYVSDSTLELVSQKDVGVHGNGLEAAEQLVSQGKTDVDTACRNSLSGTGDGLELLNANRPTLGFLERGEKRRSGSHSSVVGAGRFCVVPQSSLRPLVGKVCQIYRRLKINLLDIDAALPEESLRPSKAHLERRWAWRAFVKSAVTIYEMVQATIVLEDMIKTEYLRNKWWYWSSFSAAAKISTMSSLALRIYSLDGAILYEKLFPSSDPTDKLEPTSVLDLKLPPTSDSTEKTRLTRKSNKKRKEPEG